MADREKVIKGLEICRHRVISQENCKECPYIYDGRAKQSNCEGVLHWDALALLKEQEAQKFFVNESGKITTLPVVVRCKDCKYGSEPILAYRKGCVWCERVNRHNDSDWYCADGERKL